MIQFSVPLTHIRAVARALLKSEDDKRSPNTVGVNFSVKDGFVRVVATDGCRLHLATYKTIASDFEGFSIPLEALSTVIKMRSVKPEWLVSFVVIESKAGVSVSIDVKGESLLETWDTTGVRYIDWRRAIPTQVVDNEQHQPPVGFNPTYLAQAKQAWEDYFGVKFKGVQTLSTRKNHSNEPAELQSPNFVIPSSSAELDLSGFCVVLMPVTFPTKKFRRITYSAPTN